MKVALLFVLITYISSAASQMASDQIRISIKPRRGAHNFCPFDTITMRMVPMVTSSNRDTKIRNGSRK